MKKVAYAALFASLCFITGILFGIFIAFFARQYTVEQLVESRIHRFNIINGRANNARQ